MIIMMFTGCQKIDISIKINPDGTSQIYECISVDLEEMVNARIKVCKVLGMSDQEIGTKENLEKIYSDYYKKQGQEEVIINGKKYYQTIQKENNKKKNLTKSITGNNGYVTTDTIYYKVDLKSVVENMVETQAKEIAK